MPHNPQEPLNIFDLSPEATLQLDVEACAHHIELLYGDVLLPEPKGVYLFNKLDPVMVPGAKYYTYLSKGVRCEEVVTFENLVSVKSAVYDERGSQVISSFYAKNKKKFLAEKGFLPYRGLKIAELLIQEQLAGLESARYLRQRFHFLSRLQQHIVAMPVEKLEEFSETITTAARDVRRDIAEFIANKDWNLYNVRPDGGRMCIDRYMDYRAFDWMQRREQGEFT